MNYFELFDLPLAPTVDKSILSKKYFELQKKFHPDFFSNSEENEREEMLQQSASVNKAYKTFQNPDLTIEYFLQTTGLITPDEKYNLPADFLMEMMEVNEGLTEDEPGTLKVVAEFQEKLREDIKHILENYSTGSVDGADMEKLKSYYYRRKYLKRILDRLAD